MKIVGIIAEYNPFHNGHIYHLEKVKELYPDSCIVLVLSGNFTQRGIPSIMNKWEKTRISLEYGVDLVIELPFPFSCQGADIFAKGSITILKELGVEVLMFGSEENNKEKLINLAHIQLENGYDEKVKLNLKKGINYPTALNNALKDLTGMEVTSPNDLLGLSYIKEIIKQNANIKIETIQRTNSYHDKEMNSSTSSATSIRSSFKDGKKINNQVPIETLKSLQKQAFYMEDYFPYLRYLIYHEEHLEKYLDVDEGIENRIKEKIDDATSFEDLIQKVKTKRYTYNRLFRMFTHILVGFTKEDRDKYLDISYIRVLGFTKKGQKLLNERKKKINIPIVTKFQKNIDGLLLEKKVTSIYASVLEEDERNKLIQDEYKKQVIVKE